MGGVVFSQNSARRISAAVRKVEGGPGSDAVGWHTHRSREELIQVFKVGGIATCGVVMGQPAYWKECNAAEGDQQDCVWKIKLV